jgi:hypothetical protein
MSLSQAASCRSNSQNVIQLQVSQTLKNVKEKPHHKQFNKILQSYLLFRELLQIAQSIFTLMMMISDFESQIKHAVDIASEPHPPL